MKNLMKQAVLIFNVFILSILLCKSSFVYSQENESPEDAYWWYLSQRTFPYDTFPANCFQNAANQRDASIANDGYETPSGSWNFMGPMPYASGFGTVSGRVKAVKFDPRDHSGQTFVAVKKMVILK